jgi:hypothetical protein
MSEFAQVLFQEGKATPLMLARWRAKGALDGLSPHLQLTERGIATADFRSVWAAAFPTRDPLPHALIHDGEGRPTVMFHRVFR